MTVVLAATLCAAAAALLVPPSTGRALVGRRSPGDARGDREGDGGGNRAPDGTRGRCGSAAVRPGALLAAGLAAAAFATGLRPPAATVPLALTGLLVAGVGLLLARRSRATARARARRAAVIEACDALAAGLRAGQPPQRVLERVAADVPTLRPAAMAAGLGADVAAALRTTAGTDGAEGLRLVAAAWTVAQRSGAGLADVVSRIAGAVRAEAEQRRQVEVALGTSRSTARLLAGLPLLGIALGTGLDADPLHVLFGSAVGGWCLLIGISLAAAGVLWVERLADGAQR